MELPSLTGIILAGGKATRMGGCDKGLVPLNNKVLYQWVLERLVNQVKQIKISANRNQQIYQQSGYPVISDIIGNYAGPLAGILTGLEKSTTEWVLFVPCDTPLIPLDLASRLWSQRADKMIAFATDGQRAHPTLCLINKNQLKPLQDYLQTGNRKLMLFFEQQNAQPVSFTDKPESFDNLNTLGSCYIWQNKQR